MPGINAERARHQLIHILRAQGGLDVVRRTPAGGESRSAFWLTERSGQITLLKLAGEYRAQPG